MTAASSSAQPRLSAAAEELLNALERSAGSSSRAPGDPFQWLSALILEHSDSVGAVATSSQLGALQSAMAEGDGGTGGTQPLKRSEVADQAGEYARKEGRLVISSQDVVSAVLTLVTERMATGARASTEARQGALIPESVSDSGSGPGSPEAEILPASMAAEEMLEGIGSRLGIRDDETAGVFRWLEDLLSHHEVVVDGAGGDGKLEGLKEWGKAREASGHSTLSLTTQQVRVAAGQYAMENGQAIITPQDVAIAIVKLAMEAFTSAKGQASAPPEPSEPSPEATQVEPPFEDAIEVEDIPETSLTEGPRDRESGSPKEDSGTVPDSRSPHTLRTRTFRLFVSSTFQDLQAERNVLQQVTFPRLRDFCARNGARFQAIDLRWGVSEEASIDQQTMNICLGEIRRCHQVTPKPNFLVLLGDRYGWLPPPPQIPAQEFEEILGRVEVPEERERLERWYRKDLNADPPEYRLRPRSGKREEFRDWAVWNPEEESIRKTLDQATGTAGLGLSPMRRKIYQASATEQEVLAGALDVAEPEDKVFCVFRRIQGYPSDEQGNPLEGSDAFVSVDSDDRDKLQRLKLRLVDHVPGSCILSRTVQWGDQGPDLTEEYLEATADWVAESLEEAILRELAHPRDTLDPRVAAPDTLQSDSALSGEVREHLAFAEERRRFFVGREDVLGRISEYVHGEGRNPLAIVGEGGSGKSALMAEAVRRIGRARSGGVAVVRFVGATPGSSEGRFLLEGLCREIALRYGADPGEIPTDYQELVPKLAEQFRLASQENPLVLLVDSLDQLSQTAKELSWIPSTLPPHVRLLVSTRPDEVQDRLQHRGASILELGPLSGKEGKDLLEAWLSSARPSRRLQPHQVDAVLEAFSESDGNPLYLKLAAEEARRWPAWAEVGEDFPSDVPTAPLARGVREIIRDNLLSRLADGDNHGSVLVSRAVGYLAASRYGLAEDELIQLLSRDPDVYAWFLRGTMHLPRDLVERAAERWTHSPPEVQQETSSHPGQEDPTMAMLKELRLDPERLRTFLTDELGLEGLQLPVVLWSRLFLDLEPYLTERRAEGADLFSFYHRELGEVAREQYLFEGRKEEIHGRLADYFRSRADPGEGGAWEGEGVRGLSELPYHLTHAGRWDDLYQTLTDFTFLEQKAARVGMVERTSSGGKKETFYTGVFQLQEDFDLALGSIPGGEEKRAGEHPLIVTAVDFGEGLVVRCPWCNTLHPLVQDWLGREISCPNEECEGPLKVNAFTVGNPFGGPAVRP